MVIRNNYTNHIKQVILYKKDSLHIFLLFHIGSNCIPFFLMECAFLRWNRQREIILLKPVGYVMTDHLRRIPWWLIGGLSANLWIHKPYATNSGCFKSYDYVQNCTWWVSHFCSISNYLSYRVSLLLCDSWKYQKCRMK